MNKSKVKCFQWLLSWLCCLSSIAWFSLQCHAQGGLPDPTNAPICWPRSATTILREEGTTETLLVNVTTNPVLKFADWSVNTSLVNRSDTRYQNGVADNPSLTIENLDRTDTGTYTLYANNSIGPLRTPNCTFSVEVGYRPEVNCSCNTSVCHVVNETESCFFPINDIDANPSLTSVQWLRGGSPVINSTGRYRGGSIANPSLTVINSDRNDSGTYTLTARNRFGVGQCTCCCDVQFRPGCVLNFPRSFWYNATEGDTFPINVTLTAHPDPDYVDWTLNAVPINRTGSRYIGGDTTTASLTIRQIHRRDAGLYVLYANNTAGDIVDTNCRVNVTVYYLPLCTLLSNSTLIYNEFSTFTINVILDSVPPAHTVEWTQNGGLVNRAGGRFLNGDSYQVPSLTIRNVTRRETGAYALSATNVIGSIADRTRCRVNLTIWYAPGCVTRNYSICEDAPVTLECTVDALPPIDRITWRRDGITLNVFDPRYSGGNVTTPSLTISRVTTGDQGEYECDVGNVVGTAVCPTTLEVLSKPVVSVQRTDVVLVEGQSSSLGCSVDMRINPPPVVVQWFKDGVRIDSSSGRYQHGNLNIPSLTITNIKREDAGVYSCGAINSIGDRQSRNIIVTVEYPPVVNVKYNNYGFPLYTNASLWCSVDANPQVTPGNITWVRDGRFTLPSTFCTDVRPNVRLCNVETNDAGVYRCRAIHRLATKHSDDIQVNVRDDCPMNIQAVRLMDGTPNQSGRVEVQMSRTWGTVCGRYWNPLATQVVCGMFGYSTGSSSMSGAGIGPIHIGHVRCASGATTLGECGLTSISNCTHQEDIWVQCRSSPVTVTSNASVTTTTAAPVCPAVTNTDGYLLAAIILGVLLGLSLIINCAYICCGGCCLCPWTDKCRLHFNCNKTKRVTKRKDGKVESKETEYKKSWELPCCSGKEQGTYKDDSDNDGCGCFRWFCCSGTRDKPPDKVTDSENSDSNTSVDTTPRFVLMPTSKPGTVEIGEMDSKQKRPQRSKPSVDNKKTEVEKHTEEKTKEKEENHRKIRDRGDKDRENKLKKMRRKKSEETPPEPEEPQSNKDTHPLIILPPPDTKHKAKGMTRTTIPGTTTDESEDGDGVGRVSQLVIQPTDDDIKRVIDGLPPDDSLDTRGSVGMSKGFGMTRVEADDSDFRKQKSSKSKDDRRETNERKPRTGRRQGSGSRERRKRQSRSEESTDRDGDSEIQDRQRIRRNYREVMSSSEEGTGVYDNRHYRAIDDFV